MNTNLTPFNFEGSNVRVIIGDQGPWFVAADVCRALEISNPRDAVSRLDDDEKGVASTDTLGGTQSITIINESGLYSLIMTSRKEAAKRFKKWVTSEVLPSIRKTGRYEVAPAAPALPDFTNPVAAARAWADAKEAEMKAVAALIEAAPKAAVYDKIAATNDTFCIRDAGKAVGMAQKEFFDWLRLHGYIFRQGGDWRAYQDKIDSGLFEHKVRSVQDGEKTTIQCRITSKGIAVIAKRMDRQIRPMGNA